jgi:lipopolysaccharide export system permease protein
MAGRTGPAPQRRAALAIAAPRAVHRAVHCGGAMTILSRYIALGFLRFWLACLAGVLALIVISALLGNVNEAVQSWPAFWRFWLDTARTVPGLLEILLPMTVLLATVLTFAGLSRSSELVAMKTAGMGYLGLLRPVLLVIAGISALAYFNQNYLYRFLGGTETLRRGEDRYQWRDIGDAIVYVDRVDTALHQVRDSTVFRWQLNPFRMTQVTALPRGVRSPSESWSFGQVRVREKQNETWSFRVAPEVVVPAAGFPDVFKPSELDAHHMPVVELYQEIAVRKSRSQPTDPFELELLRKLAVVAAPLVMVLIGTPLSQFHFRGGKVAGEVLITLLVGLVFMISSEILFILGKGGLLNNWIADFGVDGLFALAGLVLMRLRR